MKTVKFDVASAPEELWDSYFRHVDELQLETDPEEPLLPRGKRKVLAISARSNPDVSTHRFLLFPGGGPREAAGYAAVFTETPHSPSYKANKHTANLQLSVSKQYRGKGLGALLLKRVIKELAAKEPAVTEFLVPVVLESGKRFMDRLGGTVSLETAENRLYLKDVDWAMVESWSEEGGRKNPATAILTVAEIPEGEVKEYSEVYTETANQQPFGDVEMEIKYTPEQIRFGDRQGREQGIVQTTMFSKESDGRISGLTEIFYMKEAAHKLRQNLTGVRTRYRRRGLGRLLKAGMLLYIRKEYPGVKYIVTGNADANAPMLAINHKLGFKKHLPIKLYKLKIQGLSAR